MDPHTWAKIDKGASYMHLTYREGVERPPTHTFVDNSALLQLLQEQLPIYNFGVNTNYLDVYDGVLTLITRKRDDLWYLFQGNDSDEAHQAEYFHRRSQCWDQATKIVLESVLMGRPVRAVPLSQMLSEQLKPMLPTGAPANQLQIPAVGDTF